MTLRCGTMSNQRWNYVLYATVEICNIEQRWINIAYFNVDKNNVRQRRNNVVIFNVDFHNVGQCRNNVVYMTISIFFTLFRSSHRRCSLRKGVYCFSWLLLFIPHCKRNMLKNTCKAWNLKNTGYKNFN